MNAGLDRRSLLLLRGRGPLKSFKLGDITVTISALLRDC